MFHKMMILTLFLIAGCVNKPVVREEIGEQQYILSVKSTFLVENSNKLLEIEANNLCFGEFKIISVAKTDKSGNNQVIVVKCTGEGRINEAKKQL